MFLTEINTYLILWFSREGRNLYTVPWAKILTESILLIQTFFLSVWWWCFGFIAYKPLWVIQCQTHFIHIYDICNLKINTIISSI